MDRRERFTDPEETLRAAMDDFSANLWTATPGIVVSFNAAAMTVRVQPSVQGRLRSKSGEISYVQIPPIDDVPVIFPSGGGFSLTFPIAPGDECLVVFANNCIDGWWQSGGVQLPAEIRLHDISDGFAFVGPRSQPNVITVADHPRLTSNDGTCYIEMSGNGTITLTAPTSIVLNTPIITGSNGGSAGTIAFDGSLAVTNGDITADTISLKHHVHSGVQTGSDDTGQPVP